MHTPHEYISHRLQLLYPGRRGLSARSVRRFCAEQGIRARNLLSDNALDQVIQSQVSAVGQAYRRLPSFYKSPDFLPVQFHRINCSRNEYQKQNSLKTTRSWAWAIQIRDLARARAGKGISRARGGYPFPRSMDDFHWRHPYAAN